MSIILSGITSLTQHLITLKTKPQDYRPEHCPHCGLSGLWCHGTYLRESDRENPLDSSLNPIPIPRFFCPACQQTCSVLPECIPPRRWYLWSIQQIAFLLLLKGQTLADTSEQLSIHARYFPCDYTLWRWWSSLQASFSVHAFCLRGRFPKWGHCFKTFWFACLTKLSLAKAMFYLHQEGVVVP